jgi:TolB protein
LKDHRNRDRRVAISIRESSGQQRRAAKAFRRLGIWVFIILGALLGAHSAMADRKTVLAQIDVPHNYYFREMFLPQLTSGPSGVDWSADGKTLVYSMDGNLWRQDLGTSLAVQLTDGNGLDYQPDWSPDGASVVFSRYDGQAVELMSLSTRDGKVVSLTDNGAVNTQARFSPDGGRIAWVTTADDGHFRVAVADVSGGLLEPRMLRPARKSEVYRYYYSAWDHELSPTWSPDGKELILVANPEIPYGSGALWRVSVDGQADPVAVQVEETSWQTQPDWAPDGKRVIYSSYLGRQWHQLWITTTDGKGHPFPLSYGDFDITAARFSPAGDRIAYISNQEGELSLWVQDTVGGARQRVKTDIRKYLKPRGRLDLTVLDANSKPVAARVSVTGPNGRGYGPRDAWMRADDGFDPELSKYELQYFHTPGKSQLELPPGDYRITVWRGPEHKIGRHNIEVMANTDTSLRIVPSELQLPSAWSRMVGADVHVHMNYGGRYLNSPTRMLDQARAEDLDIVFNLLVNKEQRVPDIDYFSALPDRASSRDAILTHSQEYHTSYWGHLGLLGLNDHYLLPGYVAYPDTGTASLWPSNSRVADLAHAQGALVGYVHPFNTVPDPAADERLTNALPVDVALGKVDYFEVVGFADPLATAEVWHRLLNCGFRISAAGGTDAMANYASYRGPVGQNRVYVQTATESPDPSARVSAWLLGLKQGRSVATNGPLVYLEVNGQGPGSELSLDQPATVQLSGFLRSNTPIDNLEILRNGKLVRRMALDPDRMSADFDLGLEMSDSGWILVRAWNNQASPDVLDVYPYATTNPVFVTVGGQGIVSDQDADYFISWIDRVLEAAETHPGYNNDAEREAVVSDIKQARQEFQARRENNR